MTFTHRRLNTPSKWRQKQSFTDESLLLGDFFLILKKENTTSNLDDDNFASAGPLKANKSKIKSLPGVTDIFVRVKFKAS